MKLRLQNVRLAFAHQIFAASAVEEGKEPKFGCDSLLVPGSSVVKQIAEGKWVPTNMQAVMEEVAADTIKGGKSKEWLAGLENSKRCYRNGDLRVNKSGDPYEGYEGVWYVAAKNKARPYVCDTNPKVVLVQADGKPYSGCYANVTIEVYGIADPKRKGVHAALKGVQFVKDGDAFGSGGIAKPEDFDEIDAGAHAEDLV